MLDALTAFRGMIVAGDDPCKSFVAAADLSAKGLVGMVNYPRAPFIVAVYRAVEKPDFCAFGRTADRSELLAVIDTALAGIKDKEAKDAELEAETKRWLEHH